MAGPVACPFTAGLGQGCSIARVGDCSLHRMISSCGAASKTPQTSAASISWVESLHAGTQVSPPQSHSLPCTLTSSEREKCRMPCGHSATEVVQSIANSKEMSMSMWSKRIHIPQVQSRICLLFLWHAGCYLLPSQMHFAILAASGKARLRPRTELSSEVQLGKVWNPAVTKQL